MDYGCFDGQRKLDHTTERLQGGFKVPMETGRNLEHTTERHQRAFKVPMETGSLCGGRPVEGRITVTSSPRRAVGPDCGIGQSGRLWNVLKGMKPLTSAATIVAGPSGQWCR